jgi:MADS-box transcription factor
MMQPSMNQLGTYSHSQYAAPPQPHHQSQTEAQARAEAYINETRRQSMPASFHPEQPAPENEPPQRADPPAPQPVEPKRAPAKSRSMFTPIGPSESMLAAHFGFGQSQETGRSHSVDVGAVRRKNAEIAKAEEKAATVAPPAPIAPPPLQPISASPPPLSRNNSLADPKSAGMRPKLKVRIPSEHSDAGSAAGSSPRESTDTAGNLSARPGGEGGPVVLPPPSPSHSVGALLSAGASGPTNPFSRPPPTSTQPEQTPMSALPSRFTEAMLPSPSQFYGGDWMNMSFPGSRGGPNGDNMLPSPLNFQTPIGGSSTPFFKQEPETNNKRRSPDSEQNESSTAKRQKNG